jgi:hypothetical protein
VQHRPNPTDSNHSGMDLVPVGIAFGSTPTIFPTMCTHSWAIPSAASSRVKKSTTPCLPTWPATSRICRTETARQFAVRLANADANLLPQNDKKYDLDELARGAGSREAPTCH